MKLVFTIIICFFGMAGFAQKKTSHSASQTIQLRLQKVAVVDAKTVKTSVAESPSTTTTVSGKWLATANKSSDPGKFFSNSISSGSGDEPNDVNATETTVYTLTPL